MKQDCEFCKGHGDRCACCAHYIGDHDIDGCNVWGCRCPHTKSALKFANKSHDKEQD